jgi:hypothetical protein
MPNILANIELDEKQVKEFNKELNNWKAKQRKQLEEEVKSEIKTRYDVKLREIKEEKENFKRQQENLVEEIKEKMQKVMVKRFTGAIKEMYDELKVEARKDVMNDPRITALEEVKNVVYPLMDETVTKGYVDELSNALKMVESKEEENDKLKAQIKLKEITANLSPSVAEAVETFIGEAETEEEVVEKYARLKNLVGEGKNKKKKPEPEEKDDDEEDVDLDFDDDEIEDDEEDEDDEEVNEEGDGDASYDDEDKYDKKKKKRKKEEEEESMDEELEINPSFHYNKNEKKSNEDEYAKELNEMLKLAGVNIED